MPIVGNLEDMPLVDVVQLLHVARRSGTLKVTSDSGEAAIICRDGDIIGAIHPSPDISLGRILIEEGLVTEDQVDEAVTMMEIEGPLHKPLMSTLIELGYLEKAQGWEGLRRLIHTTLLEIVSWKRGTFQFEVDQLDIDDDFRHVPGEFLEGGGIDLKGALMEALRIFDERNREQQQRDREEEQQRQRAQERRDQLAQSVEDDDDEIPIHEQPEETDVDRWGRHREVVFLCTDGFIKSSVKAICKRGRMFSYVSGVERDLLEEMERCYADGTVTLFVADLSGDEGSGLGPKKRLAMVQRIREHRPEIPLVVISNSVSPKAYAQTFALGARTLIPFPKSNKGDKERYVRQMKQFFAVLVSCLNNIFDEAYQLSKVAQDSRMQIASLKRRVNEIQDRKTSPDVSLVVLQYVAEFLERGIIFLVRKNDLLGIGSFGVDSNGETISAAAMRLKIPLDEPSLFRHVAKTGMVFKGPTDDPVLEAQIFARIGAPQCNDVMLLPLKTENRTRAIVYGDFGRREAEAVKIDVFEILASQAGMAIEIALQRTRFSKAAPKPEYL